MGDIRIIVQIAIIMIHTTRELISNIGSSNNNINKQISNNLIISSNLISHNNSISNTSNIHRISNNNSSINNNRRLSNVSNLTRHLIPPHRERVRLEVERIMNSDMLMPHQPAHLIPILRPQVQVSRRMVPAASAAVVVAVII